MKDYEIIIAFNDKKYETRKPVVTGLDEKHAINQALNAVKRSLPDAEVKSIEVINKGG